MTGLPARDQAPLDTGLTRSESHIAVSPHHLASAAAVAIMEGGGNAVDGAVAMNAVLGVVLPDTCGPGGDLFALIHDPNVGQPTALNASGKAGSRADAEALRSSGFTEIPPRSPATITIPGCVDGWEALLERQGTSTLAAVLAPAIDLAANGFPVSSELATSLRRIEGLLAGQTSTPPLYPSGRPPRPGSMMRRPRLAATLEALSRDGRGAFYEGEVGAAISDVTDGWIAASDLESPQADWVAPIGLDALGRTGWTIPPNSQGYISLAAAWAFDRLTDLDDPLDPQYQHALIEAYRMFAWERDDVVADSPTALALDGLLDTERLSKRTQSFEPTAATKWPTTRNVPGGTAFMCTRDANGMAVSLIQSNFHGIGSGISAGDTGVFLQDRGAGFNLIPGHPNELAPGKRPLHTLSPTIWTDNGELAAVIGTRGGMFQPQYVVQVAAGLFRSGIDPTAAQSAARWQVQGLEPGADHVVNLEPGFTPNIVRRLSALGHRVHETARRQPGWGPVAVITANKTGVRGAADPRISTAAAVTNAPT